MFRDRTDAGNQLATLLAHYAGAPGAIVLGIPRGGVVVAAAVAHALKLPLDVVAAAKIGVPGNPEYAMGAVAPDGEVVVNPSAGFTPEYVRDHAGAAREKVAHVMASLRGSRPEVVFANRTVIVVDDGLATGLTALAAVRFLKRQGATVVLAVPVSAVQSAELLRPEVDRFVAVEESPYFSAVGQFYDRFGQTDDSEVRHLLGVAPAL